MKILIIITILAILTIIAIGAFELGELIGRSRADTFIRFDQLDTDMLTKAFKYHGITEANVDENGRLYFVRNGEWCLLYNKSFKEFIKDGGKYEAIQN